MRKEKLKRIPHIISGAIILLHAYERWEHGHASYLFFLLSGLVFLAVAVFHHPLAARFKYVDAVFYTIECILSALIGFEYYHVGKKGLPWAYFFAAVMQVVAILVFVRKTRKQPVGH